MYTSDPDAANKYFPDSFQLLVLLPGTFEFSQTGVYVDTFKYQSQSCLATVNFIAENFNYFDENVQQKLTQMLHVCLFKFDRKSFGVTAVNYVIY